jgi:CubicO group peptidase (beta-lactamase class C family)
MKRLLLVLLLALPLSGQERYATEIRQLERFIEAKMKETGMPAISVAIVKDDFTWQRGFGLADVENKVPATAESSYRTASITKPMTAVAVMRLVEQGKINLDAEVQAYVPYFPKKPHPVTIRQLLGHLGGISHYKDYIAEGRIREPKTTREAIKIFEDFDLVAEPGTRYNYSSYSYNLLGAVIEGASGKSYAEFMREEVWKPLGMTSTMLDNPREIIPNRVRGYTMEDGKLKNSEYVDISSRFAGGGTRSTVGDMLRFLQGVGDGKVLKPETVAMMWTPQTLRAGTFTNYGLGFGSSPQSGRFVVAHSGSQQETRTDMGWVPRQRFGYALASNYEDANLDAFANRIALIFLGDSWALPAYAGADQRVMNAMSSVWNYGLAHYDRYGAPHTANAKDLAAAFRYFNEATRKRDEKALREGRHPVGNESFIKIGSYMASQLARSGVELNRYHNSGPLAFFDDYVALYRKGGIARANRFEPAIETLADRGHADWDRVTTADIKSLELSSPADLARFEREIQPSLTGSIIPHFGNQILEIGEGAAMKGDFATAARAAASLMDTYPEWHGSSGFAGVLAVAGGQTARGLELLKRSRAADPSGYASKGNLNNIAGFLDGAGNKAAAQVLREF